MTIRLSSPTTYSIGTLDAEGALPFRVYVDLDDTTLGASTPREQPFDAGPLVRMRTGQFTESAARVVLDFKIPAPFTVKAYSTPFRIVLSVGHPAAARTHESQRAAGSGPPATPATAPSVGVPLPPLATSMATASDSAPTRSASTPPPANPEPAAPKTGTRPHQRETPPPTDPRIARAALPPAPPLHAPLRVVIDPGHGGKDPGARSVDGAWEKDIVLSVAKFLATRVRERLGVEVILTRVGDQSVSIRRRAAMAERARLLISIHGNACPESWVEGVQTFYAPEGENAVESRRLAGLVHQRVVRAIHSDYGKVRDGGVLERSLGILRLSGAPSLLLEAAYLSNPADRRRLDDPEYRRAITDGIVDGIADFLAGVPDPRRLLASR